MADRWNDLHMLLKRSRKHVIPLMLKQTNQGVADRSTELKFTGKLGILL